MARGFQKRSVAYASVDWAYATFFSEMYAYISPTILNKASVRMSPCCAEGMLRRADKQRNSKQDELILTPPVFK